MRHILLLTDRDWTHPQGGGTGANLFGQVAHWLDWGHRVTVVAGTYDGRRAGLAAGAGLELHHMGSRTTVFPRAAWAVRRGLARDADVVLEVVNGITFLTPLWLRRAARDARAPHPPRPLRDRAGAQGAVAALVAETLPLKLLYGGAPFLTISRGGARATSWRSACRRRTCTSATWASCRSAAAAGADATPRLLYLGRLKRYKRIELLLDVVEGDPRRGARHRRRGRSPAGAGGRDRRRGLGDRVVLHGHVSEEAQGRAVRAGVGRT